MSDSDLSLILSLPYLLPSQAQKHVTHNAALQRLDMLVQTVVATRDQSAPPASPELGDRHIVATGGSAAWAGHDGEIALWDGSAWQFFAADPGWQAQVLAEDHAVVFDGSDWAVQPPDLNNLDGVGIGTVADATNRLAVSAAATLLSHEGDDHRLKINKATEIDTASLLFQTGWSGRAEMGTNGSDGFSVKVSADGSAWTTGLEIAAASGAVGFPAGIGVTGAITGTAVQQSATDTTAGRLMRADYGYGPGNLLGAVSQSGGVPTGAVIERGSNANGDYVRFADGTQICWEAELFLSYVNASICAANWVYPAAFSSVRPTILGAVDRSSANAGATPSTREMTGVKAGAVTTSDTDIFVETISGMTNFGASDSFKVLVAAIGSWF